MLKFKKKELIQRLSMSEENAKLVMKAQNEFPELLTETNTKDFIIDGEKLCGQLDVKDDFNTWLLGETRYDKKGKLKSQGKLIKYRCVENTDYISDWDSPNAQFSKDEIKEMSPQRRSAYKIKNIIKLTLHTAKMIAMRQNNEKGDLICKYFIILEEAIKDMSKWYVVRHPEKESYKSMCAMLDKQYQVTHDGKKPNFFIYTNNADMINLCMFGKKSKAMKQILDVEYDDLLRDSLTVEANKGIHEVQLLNENLILSNIDFQTRKQIIDTTCKTKYMDIRIKIVSEFHKELMNIQE